MFASGLQELYQPDIQFQMADNYGVVRALLFCEVAYAEPFNSLIFSADPNDIHSILAHVCCISYV